MTGIPQASARALAGHIETLIEKGLRVLVDVGPDTREVVEVLDGARLLTRAPRQPDTAIWCGPPSTVAAADVHALTVPPGRHGRLAVTPFDADAAPPLGRLAA